MIKKYNLFRENMDQAKSIMAKKMEAFEKLKKLLVKNNGYLGKFTEYLMYENISYDDLVDLYNRLLSLKSRNKNIDINNLKYENVIDKIIMTENDILVFSLINKFPSEQKDIARKMVMSGKEISRNSYYNIFLKIANKDNIEAFTSKISRYKDNTDLFNAASIFSKDRDNDIDKVKDKLKGIKSEIVFESDDSLIIQVASNADLKILASDASWCILGPSTWNNYVKDGRKQFMMLDYSKDEFDPEFKIGFTLNKGGGIHAAHDILDRGFSNKLESVLDSKGVKLKELMKVSEVTTLPKSNSLEELKLFISDVTVDVVRENATKILDKIGYGGKSRGYGLTPPRIQLMVKLVKKLFGSDKVITKETTESIDKRLYKYLCDHPSSVDIARNRFVRSDVMIVSDKSIDAIKAGLEIWTDKVVFDYSGNLRNILKSGKDFSEFNEDNFYIDRESILLIRDRLNKIYKSKSYLEFSESERNLEGFLISVVLVNYILREGDKTPDHDKLIRHIPEGYHTSFIGLFSKEVDISKTGISLSYGTYPIEKIKKMDYNDGNIYITDYKVESNVSRLLSHLKGYKVSICFSKSRFTSILHKLLNSEDPYVKHFVQTMKMFNKTLRAGQSITNGDLTITLKG